MIHTIHIAHAPENSTLAPDSHPFSLVRQEKAVLRQNGILVTQPVGIRLMGYFRYTGGEELTAAKEALGYGLMKAQFQLQPPMEWDLRPLLCERKAELIDAANEALREAESPYQLTEVIFTYADDCFHDGRAGQSTQRYGGFIMGSNGMHQITVHKPKGIPGEWPCVCGAYATGDVCGACGIRRPLEPKIE